MMDASERALLEATVLDALANPSTADGSSADAALADLDWLEMLAAEPSDAIGIVFRALGKTNRAATVLDDVVAAALGTTPRPDLAVLLPEFGAAHAPGRGDAYAAIVGLTTARVLGARDVLIVHVGADEPRAVMVPASSIEVRAVHGLDPDLGLHTVRVERLAPTGNPLDAGAWDFAVALGRRAIAHQLAGGSRAILGLACAHALEREQFGRRIASFQAVRHRLAEALVAVEATDATLDAAADEPNALTAALAKATAGRTARVVAGHCQQVLAGIGFTTDHPFHRFLKRTMVLDGLFGSADDITLDIGRQLMEARRVPTVVEL